MKTTKKQLKKLIKEILSESEYPRGRFFYKPHMGIKKAISRLHGRSRSQEHNLEYEIDNAGTFRKFKTVYELDLPNKSGSIYKWLNEKATFFNDIAQILQKDENLEDIRMITRETKNKRMISYFDFLRDNATWFTSWENDWATEIPVKYGEFHDQGLLYAKHPDTGAHWMFLIDNE